MFCFSVESLASRVSVEDEIPNIDRRRLVKEDSYEKARLMAAWYSNYLSHFDRYSDGLDLLGSDPRKTLALKF